MFHVMLTKHSFCDVYLKNKRSQNKKFSDQLLASLNKN